MSLMAVNVTTGYVARVTHSGKNATTEVMRDAGNRWAQIGTYLHLHGAHKEIAVNLAAGFATFGRFDVVHAALGRAAVLAQHFGLERLGHFKARLATLILTDANVDALMLDGALSVNTNLVARLLHKFPLTYGRPYGRIELQFFGGS